MTAPALGGPRRRASRDEGAPSALSVLAEAARWVEAGVGCGRATVVRALGPAPFRVGSTLVVADDGRLAGSVSAGCIEGSAVEAVLAARRGRYRELVHYGISDPQAAEAGLACGGTIDVLIEPDVSPEALAAASDDRDLAVATPLPVGREAPNPAHVVLDGSGIRSGSLGDRGADARLTRLALDALREGVARTVEIDTRAVYIDVSLRPMRLVVVGAGDIAVHLVRLAHAFGCRTVVIDARSAFATRERFPDADEILVGWADDLADRAGIDGTAHVVCLAHDAKFDDPALAMALRRGARYVGALGSRRAHLARLERLRAVGLDDGVLARIHGPIGLDIGAATPAEIALAILAEIIAERHRAPETDGELAAPISPVPAGTPIA